MEIEQFAQVIIDIPNRKLDKEFSYRVPDNLAAEIKIGTEVIVPFGRRYLKGYVISLSDEKTVREVRDIEKRGSNLNDLTSEQVELARWISEYYLCPLILALKAVALGGSFSSPRETVLEINKEKAQSYLKTLSKRATQQRKVLEMMLNLEKNLTPNEIIKISGVSLNTLNTLKKKGILETREKEIREAAENFSSFSLPLLSEESREQKNKILGFLQKEETKTILLRQDKKEKWNFYLNLTAEVLKAGFQSIVLVPEITFTPELVKFFKDYFGQRAAVLHSALSSKERYYNLKKIKDGQADVVIGTRSAIFAPLQKPKLFIIDEEAEPSYRQESDPKYHTRDVALWRANYHRAVVLLNSFVPSLESYHEAKSGNYELEDYAALKNLPPVKIVDMRRELKNGNTGIFSNILKAKLEESFKEQKKAALLINRRGYAGLLICRDCGKALECPHCSVSLVYHKYDELRCHYCNYRTILPQICPHCGSLRLRPLSWGTQKVEEEIKKLLPEIRTLRIDSDVVSKQREEQRIKEQLVHNDIQLIIGTPLIFKYMKLVDINLAGIVNIDSLLYLPDFRGREKVLQTLAKMVFSLEAENEIIVQTHNPQEINFLADALSNYEAFYYYEIQRRSRYNYPPFTHFARLMTISRQSEWAEKASYDLLNLLQNENKFDLKILGPAPAAIFKLRDRYRWQLTLKGEKREEVKEVIAQTLKKFNYSTRKVALSVDIDPL